LSLFHSTSGSAAVPGVVGHHYTLMNPFKWIEKLITERGSAAIMEKRLALKDDEITKLHSKIRELDAAHDKEKVESDDIRLHKGIEFRRGIKTAGKWMAFCPKCHMPVSNRDGYLDVSCSDKACKWIITLDDMSLSQVIGELEV